MNIFSCCKDKCESSSCRRTLQVILLSLIVIGVGLLLTQDKWVPKLVSYLMRNDKVFTFTPQIATSTPTTTPVIKATTTPTTPIVHPKVDSGVEAKVTIGPTCPVMRFPPEEACKDKPYATTFIISSTIPGKNGGILVHSNADGYFFQELAPGTYTIRSQSEAILPRFSPVTFEVKIHKRITLDLQFDSGIR